LTLSKACHLNEESAKASLVPNAARLLVGDAEIHAEGGGRFGVYQDGERVYESNWLEDERHAKVLGSGGHLREAATMGPSQARLRVV
jgi:hypothetical protein